MRFAALLWLIAFGAAAKDLPARDFNRPMGHALDVVKLGKHRPVYLRDAGSHELLDGSGKKETVKGGDVAVQGIGKGAGDLYYVWGHGADSGDSGFVRGRDLARKPRIDPSKANGNGRAARLDGKKWRIAPQPIPAEMRFPRFDGKAPSTFRTYGLRNGNPRDAYLSWTTPDHPGGGIARTIVHAGNDFRPARVQRVVMTSVGAVKGTVTFAYGAVSQRGQDVFGWLVVEHVENGRKVAHVRP